MLRRRQAPRSRQCSTRGRPNDEDEWRDGPREMSLARRAFGVGRLAAALTRPSVLGRKALGRGKREQAPALESAQPNRDQDGCIETSGNGGRGVYRLEFHPILSRCPSRL